MIRTGVQPQILEGMAIALCSMTPQETDMNTGIPTDPRQMAPAACDPRRVTDHTQAQAIGPLGDLVEQSPRLFQDDPASPPRQLSDLVQRLAAADASLLDAATRLELMLQRWRGSVPVDPTNDDVQVDCVADALSLQTNRIEARIASIRASVEQLEQVI